MLSLVLSAMFGIALVSSMGDDEDGDNVRNAPEDENQDELVEDGALDDLTTVLDRDASGEFVGSSGNDTIFVEAEVDTSVHQSPNFEFDEYPNRYYSRLNLGDGKIGLGVDGGEGDDHLILSGSGYIATGGEGNDLIEVGDAQDVVVFGGSTDTIVGGTSDWTVTYLEGEGSFVDGGGGDYIFSSSSQLLDLGEGNDVFYGTDDIAQEVHGGEGNDVLLGNISDEYLSWHHADNSLAISTDADTLNGDNGNDFLKGSYGDILIGGSGIDNFQVNVNYRLDAEVAIIEDFDAEQEKLTIGYDAPDGVFDYTVFRVNETEYGDTLIIDNLGNELALIKGVTGLSVGVYNSSGSVDLSGNPVDNADCSVLIFDILGQ